MVLCVDPNLTETAGDAAQSPDLRDRLTPLGEPSGLTVQGLTIERGERLILSGVTFTLEPGTIAIFTGPNGAGKTTLLRTVCGLLAPVEGAVTVTLDGAQESGPAARRRAMAYVGHADRVRAALSVREHLRFWRALIGDGAKTTEAHAHALAWARLEAVEDAPAGYLSAGQRRRLALSALTLTPRAIWILDEPTANLDSRTRAAVAELVRAHAARGGIVLAATHDALDTPEARRFVVDAGTVRPVQASA